MISSDKENIQPVNVEQIISHSPDHFKLIDREDLLLNAEKTQIESRKMLLEFRDVVENQNPVTLPDVLLQYSESLSFDDTIISSIKESSDFQSPCSSSDQIEELALRLRRMTYFADSTATKSSDDRSVSTTTLYQSNDTSERSDLQSPEASKDQADELLMRVMILTKAERTKFQNAKKQIIMKSSYVNINEEQLAKIWQDSEAEIEDVIGGICISIYLPKMTKLRVFEVNGKKVCIEASRKSIKDDVFAHKDNTEFIADFDITGSNATISQSDINYEYFAGIGILFVYLENISLSAVQDNLFTRFTNSNNTQKSKSIISVMKKGLKQIFG